MYTYQGLYAVAISVETLSVPVYVFFIDFCFSPCLFGNVVYFLPHRTHNNICARNKYDSYLE
uniref:Uncharacterized protein n=1 Tax=Anguilla anguilla TaxID=7936 RepID=A0A0E9WKK5_ANGAN